jgi:tetratricopeptide (TPR) repeat protein
MKYGFLIITFLIATNFGRSQSCDKLIENIELSFQSNIDPKKDIQVFNSLCAKSSSYHKGKLQLFRLKQYRTNGQFEKGLDYGESILKQVGDEELNAEILLETATIHYILGDYDKTIPVCYTILNTGIKNKKTKSKTFSMLANAHWKMENNEYAEKYFRLSFESAREINDSSMISLSLNGLGLIDYSEGTRQSMKSAVDLFNEAISFTPKGKLTFLLSANNNLAAVYYQLKDYTRAKRIFKQCVDLAEQVRDTASVIRSLNNLGTIALIQKDLEPAKNYLYQSFKIHQQHSPGEPAPSALLLSLSDLHYALGDYKQSRDYYEKYSTSSLELLNAERNQAMIEMQEKYDALNKKKEIKDLKLSALIMSEVLTQAIQWTCAIVFLLLFRKLDRPYRLMAIISFIQTPIVMVNTYMLSLSLNNSMIKHISTHIEFLLLGACFYLFFTDRRFKKGLLILGGFYAAFSVIDTIYLEPLTVIPSNIIVLGSMICLLCALGLLYQIFLEGKMLYIDQHPYFWLSCSVLIFFGCTIFISLFNNFIVYNLPLWIYNFFFSVNLFFFFVSKVLLLYGAYLLADKHHEYKPLRQPRAIQIAK